MENCGCEASANGNIILSALCSKTMDTSDFYAVDFKIINVDQKTRMLKTVIFFVYTYVILIIFSGTHQLTVVIGFI